MKIFQIIIAILTIIILPLIGIVYSNMHNDIKDNGIKITQLDSSKVSNDTLVLMLNQQNIIIQNNKDEFNRVYREIRDIRLKVK